MAEEELGHMVNWVYDLMLWSLSILIDLFFREVHPRGSWRVPRRGPIMFVAAPHANQFVDSLILMRLAKTEAKRRISFLIAQKSMKQREIGTFARAAGAIPVARAQDNMKPGQGTIYLPDPVHDASLLRGVGTAFDRQLAPGSTIQLPMVGTEAAQGEVGQILGPEELRLKRDFSGSVPMQQLTGSKEPCGKTEDTSFQGSKYKFAPKVDQNKVYDAVFDRLRQGGCVGIFPEGGSHDRPELLPLKAGVAVMALGTLSEHPDIGLKIVPCGMNYFHAHKFRSRAVVEFGTPLDVPTELVDMFRSGERREATRRLLEIIYQALVAVTVTSPDYDTLMLIQAARRLYNPKGKKLPLPKIIELNRRLVKGYVHYKDDPRIVNLKKSVNAYNEQLWLLGVRDHQVEYAKFSIPKVVFTLIYRLGKLIVLTAGVLPGLILFTPIFVASKVISIKKSRAALAASTVKLQGRDVMATWKLLVALGLAPLLYTWYTVLLTYWTYYNRVQGYVPDWVPLWLVVIFGYTVSISITVASLRFGETGMDIVKSLRPLILSLIPSSANTLNKLRSTREKLSAEVTEVINTLGPEMFPDFDSSRIIADPFRDMPGSPKTPGGSSAGYTPTSPQQDITDANIGAGSSTPHRSHGTLPRNESFKNFGGIGLFASRPPSRHHSRTNSLAGFPVQKDGPQTGTIGSKETLNEVSQKIRGAMRERGKERRRKSLGESGGSGSWEFADASSTGGTTTPASLEEDVVKSKKEV